MKYPEVYAVDFDGTLCRGKRYPKMGIPNFYLIEFLKDKQKNGDILILWTCREGEMLKEAVEYCGLYGLKFDYINENTEENKEKFGNDSRKIFAHHYIDDRNLTVNDLVVRAAGLDAKIWERSCMLSAKSFEGN
jgi:hypothetical protein